MLYNCPEHGINCPYNFSNIRLVLNNNKVGKPYGASASADTRSFESLDIIRKMCSLASNNFMNSDQLKGASSICEMTKQKQQSFKNILKMINLT
jgi:hypothetical protein